MLLTFIIAALAACGLILILQALCRCLTFPFKDTELYHVVSLSGDAQLTEQKVKACLKRQRGGSMRGKLIFVDMGLSPEGQLAALLLLERESFALLCGPTQIQEYIGWEKENIGTGAY